MVQELISNLHVVLHPEGILVLRRGYHMQECLTILQSIELTQLCAAHTRCS
jgi:hypothetical protein